MSCESRIEHRCQCICKNLPFSHLSKNEECLLSPMSLPIRSIGLGTSSGAAAVPFEFHNNNLVFLLRWTYGVLYRPCGSRVSGLWSLVSAALFLARSRIPHPCGASRNTVLCTLSILA